MTFEEYNKLKATIDYHMDRYYNQDSPEISDHEYDLLMQSLKAAEKEHPEWITPDSPSQKIGGTFKREAGVKVTHDVPMLSIEDVFSKDDVTSWIEKVKAVHPDCRFSVEVKIDGLSMSLRYERDASGRLALKLAETRGDGFIGEDVTANALVIPDVPAYLDLNCDSVELRGEVYMSHGAFEAFNATQEELGKKLAANPRNLAAGTLRQLDPAITKERGLKLFIFNIQRGPAELMDNHCEGLDKVNAAGIPTVFHRLCSTAEEVISVIDEIGEMRSTLDFDLDGAVIKIDNVSYRDDFPAGSKYSAGHIAYKYPPEEKVIMMDDILVDVGRTGKLTFTGIFHDPETGKPARLCGTSVSRATLHNRDYINSMHIGIGGTYKLYKSGEIIPKLNGLVSEPEKVFEIPKYCPVCGAALIEEEDTADIRCINPSCPAQLVRTLSYFASLNAMNIMGLGDTLVEALVNEDFLHGFADIYKLKDHREELIEKGIIGKEKNTDKVLANIEASKANDPVRLLTGLGIRNVGLSTAKELMKNFATLDELMTADHERLTAINDIGATTADCIIEFFSSEETRQTMSELKALGVNFSMPQTSTGSALAGLTIVVTGTLPTLGRKEVTDLIESNGGKCTGSVSKKTDLLVAGEAAGSKLTKAQELGIKIIDEAELLNLIK